MKTKGYLKTQLLRPDFQVALFLDLCFENTDYFLEVEAS